MSDQQNNSQYKPAWYNSDITEEHEIPEDMRQLLEDYSGIKRDRQVQHVLEVVSSRFTGCILQLSLALRVVAE